MLLLRQMFLEEDKSIIQCMCMCYLWLCVCVCAIQVTFRLQNTSVLSFLTQQPCKVGKDYLPPFILFMRLRGSEREWLTQRYTASKWEAGASGSVLLPCHWAVSKASISSHHFPLVNVPGGAQPCGGSCVVLQTMSERVQPAGNTQHNSAGKIVTLGSLILTTNIYWARCYMRRNIG